MLILVVCDRYTHQEIEVKLKGAIVRRRSYLYAGQCLYYRKLVFSCGTPLHSLYK